MKTLRLEKVNSLLCLGAHGDDIEIGCGGTILKLTDAIPGLDVRWIVFSAGPERAREASRSAGLFLEKAGSRSVDILEFRDGFFPYKGAQVKDYFEQLKGDVSPDLILTHNRDDLHQDHRLICELTWNTFRNHLILEYEIPKWDGDIGRPNFYVHLSETLYLKKVQMIGDTFKSQSGKQWFSEDVFLALMRLRGMECNSPSNHAEGFYARKIAI